MLHLTSCEYQSPTTGLNNIYATVGCPPGTRLQRIIRMERDVWLLWISTRNFKLGTYMLLHQDGLVERVTERSDEGPEVFVVRPSDRDIQKDENTK